VVRRIRPVSHDDKLSVVDHLDELRSRLIISLLAFVVAWVLTTWQNHLVLEIMNAPLPDGKEPITLGPTEAFTTTLMNAAYFALILAAPVILYELYAFVLPAFSPTERRIAIPLMSMIPVLFIIGVSFGYFIVLPAAVRFLQNFNSDQFNVLLQARDYYKFAVLSLAATGLVFQLPVAILALTRLGIVTPQYLTRNWRYAVVILTVIAVLLPGTDPVSTMIEAVPLYLLYALSIIMARFVGVPADDEPDALD
jgi:sec-independent protein translocase protein TatC